MQTSSNTEPLLAEGGNMLDVTPQDDSINHDLTDEVLHYNTKDTNVGVCDCLIGTIQCIAYLFIIVIFCGAWVWTAGNRREELDILHYLAKHQLVDINYHHDTIFSNNSYNSNMTLEET